MRPVEFTDEQVVEAGRTLQAQGRNITGFALRGLLVFSAISDGTKS